MFVSTTPVRAAFPIQAIENRQIEQWITYQEIPAPVLSIENNSNQIDEPKTKAKKDQGIFGILALVFALLGIFPAAIVLGIIGTQKRRKLKGLAIAGLILGLIPILFFLLAFGLFIAFI